MKTIYEQIENIITELNVQAEFHDTEFIVFKGIALNQCIYGNQKVRSFGDLDILVCEEDVILFNKILNHMGFYQRLGYTSKGKLDSNYGTALAAINAQRFKDNRVVSEYPVRSHQKKPGYKIYCKEGYPGIELHTGLHCIKQQYIKEFKEKGSQEVVFNKISFRNFDPRYTLLVLLTNTYQNSESFCSNSFDFDLKIEDYSDLKVFFEKYKKVLDWDEMERLINKYEIRSIAANIIYNLNEIYGNDACAGCLPGIRPEQSRWKINIIERMQNFDMTRKNALSIQRQQWLNNGHKSCFTIEKLRCKTLNEFHESKYTRKEVCYDAAYDRENLVLSTALSKDIPELNDYLYIFNFFPLEKNFEYTSYKVLIYQNGESYVACGHKTNRFNLGAVKKNTEEQFNIDMTDMDEYLVLNIIMPLKALGIENIHSINCFCMAFDIYFQHYREIYHNIDEKQAMPEMHLLNMEKADNE